VQLDKLYSKEDEKLQSRGDSRRGPTPPFSRNSASQEISRCRSPSWPKVKDIGYRPQANRVEYLSGNQKSCGRAGVSILPGGFDKVKQAALTMLTNAMAKRSRPALPRRCRPAPRGETVAPQRWKQIPPATANPTGTVTPEQIRTVTAKQVRGLVDGSKGKVVVVNFFASWCPPCLREFPAIIKVYEQYHDQGLAIFAVSLNSQEEMADINQFLQAYKPPFQIYRADAQDETFTQAVLKDWSGEMPMTLVFNTAGERVLTHKSEITYDQLSSKVEALLPVR
jgi:thiol-disulfide isomerase/thioredoxin